MDFIQKLRIPSFALILLMGGAQIAYGVASGPGAGGTSGAGSGGIDGAGSGGGGTGLINPLKSATIGEFLIKIIDVLLTFAVPIIIFFIMYGGFKLVTARGDTGQIEDGRRAITWAVVGGVIILGAKLIINVIQGTVSAL